MVAKVFFGGALGALIALVLFIAWWSVVMDLWRSPDDMKIAAVAIAAVGVALIMVGVATIGVGAVSLYKKGANRRW